MMDWVSPARGFEQDAEMVSRCREQNVWATLYTTFNDDDFGHMSDAFYNNGLDRLDAKSLHERNVEFVKEIGLDAFREYNDEPGLEPYAKEAERELRMSKFGVRDVGPDVPSDDLSLG